ncbi:NlpC/P60 family protein [Paenibacillus ginsengarvi]|uniref:Peptidoglycan endopeptidase n=1 Tax=Paenibacillus ginsengarvi TaxID=400777 RepID=A0A3B0CLM0_9BACL|nr:NlpC/P60 family protein [Paenibacillus ginsengarvi]RKN85638.1 peptidoglycan endopeptidase [Paenibacillus ginsengarvi]
MKHHYAKLWGMTLLAVSLAATTACGGTDGGMLRSKSRQAVPQPETIPGRQSPGALSGSDVQMLNADEGRIPIVDVDGKMYVSASKLAGLLGFQTSWDPASGRLLMGDQDAELELTGGSPQAVKEGTPLSLPDAPKVIEGGLLIPVSIMPDLFRDDFHYQLRDKELALQPSPGMITDSPTDESQAPETAADELSFADDPNDPYKTAETPAALLLPGPTVLGDGEEEALPVLKQIDANKVIDTAKRYLGIKYVFGAAPYPQSGVFDCSTFSGYVYSKFGVTLPRTARAQAKEFTTVSRKMLRKGDLLFFYVPGRFKSNKIVGHVGIYMGNGQMIHASTQPKNGVQITSINKPFWKKAFLLAKRVGT